MPPDFSFFPFPVKMNCAISGVVPAEPVVSKDGIVFEKRLIMKILAQNGTCPVTNHELRAEDLIEINASTFY
jgi:pre-mRNA-processing factor 19